MNKVDYKNFKRQAEEMTFVPNVRKRVFDIVRGYQNPENVRKRVFDMVRAYQNPETHIQIQVIRLCKLQSSLTSSLSKLLLCKELHEIKISDMSTLVVS